MANPETAEMGKITVLKGRAKIKICPHLSHGMMHSSRRQQTDLLHHILLLVLTELSLQTGTSHSSELPRQEETRTFDSEGHHLPDILADLRALEILNNELLVLAADNSMRRLETKS